MKKIYVPELEVVFDVYGVVGHDEDGGQIGVSFLVWNHLSRVPGFDLIQTRDCVPYEDEMIPVHGPKSDPAKYEAGVTGLSSAKYPEEKFDAGICEECDSRFECFPGLFQRPDETKIVGDHIESRKFLTRDELQSQGLGKVAEDHFMGKLSEVARRRQRVMNLKKALELNTPGVRVRSFTMSDDDRSVTLDLDVTDMIGFYGERS